MLSTNDELLQSMVACNGGSKKNLGVENELNPAQHESVVSSRTF
jgi:hypothetical protein